MNYMNIQGFNKNFYNNENIFNLINQYYNRDIFMCELPTGQGVGYLDLQVLSEFTQSSLPQSRVSFYARKGVNDEILIMTLLSTLNPIRVQLPVAYNAETLFKGPEYYFTYYTVRAESSGHYPTRILNVRMFPKITTTFNITMIPVAVVDPEFEQIIDLPPHERDVITDENQ